MLFNTDFVNIGEYSQLRPQDLGEDCHELSQVIMAIFSLSACDDNLRDHPLARAKLVELITGEDLDSHYRCQRIFAASRGTATPSWCGRIRGV